MNSTNGNATIYFDLDGTIADLYGFSGWLDCLQNEQTTPYTEAGLLVDGEQLRNFLAAGRAAGAQRTQARTTKKPLDVQKLTGSRKITYLNTLTNCT